MKRHAGSGLPHGHQNKGTAPKPSPTHAGSGRQKGILHEAPTKPMINDQNYGGQMKRK
jgi:hypothetical protein